MRRSENGAPTQSAFRDPLLLALGRATRFKPHTHMPLWVVTPYTLKLYGYDPNDPPFPRKGRKPEGLDRKIQVLCLYLKREDKWDRRKTPLTERGERGQWALTEAGVEQALRLESPKHRRNPTNLTARWLGDELHHPDGMERSPLYLSMARAIASKCSVSAATQQVDDHISGCIAKLIHRDSLRNRIMLGRSLSHSHICTYAVRSAWTDARDNATNPVCRELHGARTETERAKMEETKSSGPRVLDPRVTFSTEDGVTQLLDIAADDSDDVVDNLHFESLWGRVLDTIRVGKPKSYDRYIEVLKIKLQGGNSTDIAMAMGVSASRATSMMAEARRVLQDARSAGKFEAFAL